MVDGRRAAVAADTSAEASAEALRPTPHGRPLTLQIDCRTSPEARKGQPHEITLDADWTVRTPHDLDAERIAEAFGAYSSCLTLIDRTVPAFRTSLRLLTRGRRSHLVRIRHNAWLIPDSEFIHGCCRPRGRFPTAAKAARHLRSARHLAAVHDVPEWQLEVLIRAAEREWGSWEGTRDREPQIRSLVRESNGVTELWRAGIRPDEIATMASYAPVDEPLPVAYYIGLAYGQARPDWLHRVLVHRPDPDVAAWLVTLGDEYLERSATQLGQWLAFGLPRSDSLLMIDSGIDPVLPFRIAWATDWSVHAAVRSLVAWTRVGCVPSLDDFACLARHGVLDARLTRDTVDEMCGAVKRLLGRRPPDQYAPERTQIALIRAVLGNRTETLNAIHAGVDHITKLDAYLRAHESA
ncbi:MAG TPA: hypothetical protein GXZ60_12095 [Intrasporangiaceae bacterium]|nr:hypothetical protein [Intrasporangiaceae bacterium]